MGGGVNRDMAEEGQTALFTLVIHRPGALRRMFLHPTDLSLGDAYIHGDFDIEGDFESSFALADYFTGPGIGTAVRAPCAPNLLMLPANDRPPSGRQAARCRGPLHSLSRDRNAVQYHYDVSNDFFSLWLERLVG